MQQPVRLKQHSKLTIYEWEEIKLYLKMISISLFTEWAEPSKLQKNNSTFDTQNIYQIILYLFFVDFIDLQIFILKFTEPL